MISSDLKQLAEGIRCGQYGPEYWTFIASILEDLALQAAHLEGVDVPTWLRAAPQADEGNVLSLEHARRERRAK